MVKVKKASALSADVSAADVRKYLGAVAALTPEYRRFEGLVLEHGREFAPAAALPVGVRRGRMKECFRNAARVAMSDPARYAYAEGWAGRYIPVQHAWAVCRATGEALEVTWDSPGSYVGIAVDGDWLLAFLLASKVYGVLDGMNPRARALLAPGASLGWIDPITNATEVTP